MNKLDLEETTRKFHNIYEQVAKEYGYKTREDTKELDFNSSNGMTMLKTVEVMTTPYLEEIEELNNSITWWSNRFNAVERDNRELRDRIDKAIERLQDYDIVEDKQKVIDDTFDILRGGKK